MDVAVKATESNFTGMVRLRVAKCGSKRLVHHNLFLYFLFLLVFLLGFIHLLSPPALVFLDGENEENVKIQSIVVAAEP